MKKMLGIFCVIVVLGLSSSSFALAPILIGDFENGADAGQTPPRYDGWMVSTTCVPVTSPVESVTRGTHSLKWADADGGSWMADNISYPFGGTLDDKLNSILNPGSDIVVDVTAIPSEVASGSASMTIFYNAAGGWGFDDTLWQSLTIDGKSHTCVFHVTANIRTVINASIGGWGCNLGFATRTADASPITIYVDNIWIYPEGYTANGPYGRSETQVFNANPVYSDVTLHWNAGPDPNTASGNAVNPAIVNQYVFVTKNTTDPNLYYVGATGVDPGTVDPTSQYGPITLNSDSVYSWTVVEGMEGHTQSFTVGVSTMANVDPNNIIGAKWNFQTLSNLPIITAQPVSKRFDVNAANVKLTIGVTSATPASYQWYYSLDNKVDATDTAIAAASGGNTNTVTFTSHNKAYQAYYYCKISNSATGSNPIVSNIVSIVVERKVAEYLFDGNLNDSSGMAFTGTGVGTPTYVTGVGGSGSALSLNGTSQYVQIGNPADPNTFNKAFPRADLFTNVTGGVGTEVGSGGGLDVGSIMCWIKLNTSTDPNKIYPVMANANAGWPITWFYFGMDSDNTGANTNMRTFLFGDNAGPFWASTKPLWATPYNMGGDGQWHMLAATWSIATGGTFKQYLDGNLIASGGSASTTVFSPWNNGTMKIGFDGTNYFGGVIDNLRVYNYEVPAATIAQEAYTITGKAGCLTPGFTGSNMNVNQLGTSYCKIDLADFAALAANWLNNGFYTPVP